eukprot:8923631-Pyramimonas_sp.AAC.1
MILFEALPPCQMERGNCCSPKCLYFKNQAFEWDAMECTYNQTECFEKQACRDEKICFGDIAIRHNQIMYSGCTWMMPNYPGSAWGVGGKDSTFM